MVILELFVGQWARYRVAGRSSKRFDGESLSAAKRRAVNANWSRERRRSRVQALIAVKKNPPFSLVRIFREPGRKYLPPARHVREIYFRQATDRRPCPRRLLALQIFLADAQELPHETRRYEASTKSRCRFAVHRQRRVSKGDFGPRRSR